MTPDEARAWLPVVRDYLALGVGVGIGVWAVVADDPALAMAAFGVAGIGAVGQAVGAAARRPGLVRLVRRLVGA